MFGNTNNCVFLSHGSDLADHSRNPTDDHTLTGSSAGLSATLSANPPTIVAGGQFGNCGQFVAANSQGVDFADSISWTFGSGDFTLRKWVNLTSLPADGANMVIICQSKDVNNRWVVYIGNTSGTYILYFYARDSSTTRISQNANWAGAETGVLHYIEMGRVGTAFYISVDGTQLSINGGGTEPGTNSLANIATNLCIGYQNITGLNRYLDGKLDDLAIDKGQGPHTGSYSVPTSAGEFNNEYTVLYMPMNSNFNDSPLMPEIDTSIYKFEGSSFRFRNDNNGRYNLLFANDSVDWSFVNSYPDGPICTKWSIDFWVYFHSLPLTGSFMGFVSQYYNSANRWYVAYRATSNTAGTLEFYSKSSTFVYIWIVTTDSWTPTLHTWYHLKYARNGTNNDGTDFRIAIKGIQQNLTVNNYDEDGYVNAVSPLYIGYFDANIDEIRIMKGGSLLTPELTDFDVPTSEYSTGFCPVVDGEIKFGCKLKVVKDGALHNVTTMEMVKSGVLVKVI
jgi:hypothetical protein